jgi:hypothetical protein
MLRSNLLMTESGEAEQPQQQQQRPKQHFDDVMILMSLRHE